MDAQPTVVYVSRVRRYGAPALLMLLSLVACSTMKPLTGEPAQIVAAHDGQRLKVRTIHEEITIDQAHIENDVLEGRIVDRGRLTEIRWRSPVDDIVSISLVPRTSAMFVGGVGFGTGSMSVGGDSESEQGVAPFVEIGVTRSGFRTWFLEADVHAFEVPSPVLSEAYRSTRVMLGRSIGKEVYFAPALGLEYRKWSGPERVEDSDLGLALGLAAGAALRLTDRLTMRPELIWRSSVIELEGSVSSRLLGLRMALAYGGS
jgi:hypothetical protein